MFSTKSSKDSNWNSLVRSAQCGDMNTFGRSHRGLSVGSGSVANTSRAAPRIRLSWRAASTRKSIQLFEKILQPHGRNKQCMYQVSLRPRGNEQVKYASLHIVHQSASRCHTCLPLQHDQGSWLTDNLLAACKPSSHTHMTEYLASTPSTSRTSRTLTIYQGCFIDAFPSAHIDQHSCRLHCCNCCCIYQLVC